MPPIEDPQVEEPTPDEVEEDEDDLDLPDFTDEEWAALDTDVPWHSVLAPLGVLSGDNRRITDVEFRDFPLPLRHMTADNGGHDGAVPASSIVNAWVEEGDGGSRTVKGEGVFTGDSPVVGDAIVQIALGDQRGVSVDLDSIEMALENADGSAFDMEAWQPGDPEPIMSGKGRISAATMCAIPAFQEAFIALGTWADAQAEAEFASQERCLPCEALEALEAHNAQDAQEFAALIESGGEDFAMPETWVSGDGARAYSFDGDITVVDGEDTLVFAPGTHDGPGWITNPGDTQRLRTYWTKGKGAAKIRWGQGGDFNRCRRQLAKYIPNPAYLAGTCANLHKVALGFWPSTHKALAASAAPAFSLVASAAPKVLPAAWFLDPELDGPTPLTVTEDGRVFGHLATWGVCHIAPQYTECLTAPTSASNYAYFRTGVVATDAGDMPVGQITLGTGHAGPRATAAAAMAHYDNTGACVADVAAGDDDHGIWIAGALRPSVTDEERAILRAAALSGDWRKIGGTYELVAALAVNVPGFPIPRTALVASGGGQQGLVASGIVTQDMRQGAAEQVDLKAFATTVVNTVLAEQDRRSRLAVARRKVAEQQREALRQIVGRD